MAGQSYHENRYEIETKQLDWFMGFSANVCRVFTIQLISTQNPNF